MKVSASILSARLLSLKDSVDRLCAAGVDRIHLDIMDGRYVPRIAFGFDWLEALRASYPLPVDVHLMMTPVDQARVAEAKARGAERIWVHADTCVSSLDHRDWVLSLDDDPNLLPESMRYCLVMSVVPGAGGQAFDARALTQVAWLKKNRPEVWIAVDGGVNVSHLPVLSGLGVDEVIMGHALLSSSRPEQMIDAAHRHR